MTVSIIICTRDRAESLKLTLESISRTEVPSGWEVELLVVNNGSTDSTAATVNSLALSNISVRHILEPRKGKGYAYNTGFAASRGSVLLFTDDDVRVPVGWIKRMCHPLLAGAADAVAGGVIFPAGIAAILSRPPFSARRSWLASTENLDGSSPGRMVGANMAFHRRVLARVPRVDVDLGPGALGFGEETLYSRQLLEAGFKLAGALDVAVEHYLDQARLTPESMVDLARKMGRCDAFVFHHWEHKNSRLAVPRLLLAYLSVHWRRFFDRRSKQTPGGVSDRGLSAEYNLAFYQEFFRQRRRPHKYPRRGLAPY